MTAADDIKLLQTQQGLQTAALEALAAGDTAEALLLVRALKGWPAEPPAPLPPVTSQSKRGQLLQYARSLIGVPYEINLPFYPKQPGRGLGKQYPPDGGLDCSGYALQCLNHVGLLTHLDPLYTSVSTLVSNSEVVARGSVLAGDLVVFKDTYIVGPSHVGFATQDGGGQFISAREPAAGIDQLGGYWLEHVHSFRRVAGMD